MQHVEYDAELRRWYVRFGCDGRDAATIYFDLHQRTLRYELYFLPSPENGDAARRAERVPACAAITTCTRRGSRSVPMATSTSPVASRSSTSPSTELDRIIGVLFELTERWFQAAVTIAYRPRAEEPPAS